MHQSLRQRYPRFVYHSYSVIHKAETLTFEWDFRVKPGLRFRPSLRIQHVSAQTLGNCSPELLSNLAFHIGLAEIPSYWKATCSPEIVVEAGPLSDEQCSWWHDLWLKGLGEYFYVNSIDFTTPNFLQIVARPARKPEGAVDATARDPSNYLVLMGGGKDSIVTLAALDRPGRIAHALAVSPTRAAKDVIELSGRGAPFTVERFLDPALLSLNAQEYLNGHVPFSAYIAFVSVACAALFGYGRVAVSNERSSNEGNVRYLDHEINHQYSKTSAFEQAFRGYVRDHITETVSYFSFVRPLYELQISALFAPLERYHRTFRSCNRGQKDNVWCLACPKCLFVYTTLYPFLEPHSLAAIFGGDLFGRENLGPLALAMLGIDGNKPFECVGTHEETLVSFFLARERVVAAGGSLPPLLRLIDDAALSREPDLPSRADAILTAWGEEHCLPAELETELIQATRSSLGLPLKR